MERNSFENLKLAKAVREAECTSNEQEAMFVFPKIHQRMNIQKPLN